MVRAVTDACLQSVGVDRSAAYGQQLNVCDSVYRSVHGMGAKQRVLRISRLYIVSLAAVGSTAWSARVGTDL
jgi:hypothetical protein